MCSSNCGALHSVNYLEGMLLDSSALKRIFKNYRNKTESLVVADAPNTIIGLLAILAALFK